MVGVGSSIHSSPIHTPRLHCAQAMREDPNPEVPSGSQPFSLTNLKMSSLPCFPDKNRTMKPWCAPGGRLSSPLTQGLCLLIWSDGGRQPALLGMNGLGASGNGCGDRIEDVRRQVWRT